MALRRGDIHPDALHEVTVQDYARAAAIDGVRRLPLSRFVDDGGSFLELGRLDGGVLRDCDVPDFEVRQLSYSVVDPGAVKAFHLHFEQSEFWFVPPASKLLIGLYDVRRDSPSAKTRMRFVLGDGQAELLFIPPGVAHGAANLTSRPAEIIYVTDRHFSPDPDATDEKRLPWDLLGADFWQMERG